MTFIRPSAEATLAAVIERLQKLASARRTQARLATSKRAADKFAAMAGDLEMIALELGK